VLILTARGRWAEKVEGFDAGADDYLTKAVPYRGIAGPHARSYDAAPRGTPRRRSSAAISASIPAPRAPHQWRAVRLTSHEYKVLEYLMHHRGRVVPRTELVEHIYDSGSFDAIRADRSVRGAADQNPDRRYAPQLRTRNTRRVVHQNSSTLYSWLSGAPARH